MSIFYLPLHYYCRVLNFNLPLHYYCRFFFVYVFVLCFFFVFVLFCFVLFFVFVFAFVLFSFFCFCFVFCFVLFCFVLFCFVLFCSFLLTHPVCGWHMCDSKERSSCWFHFSHKPDRSQHQVYHGTYKRMAECPSWTLKFLGAWWVPKVKGLSQTNAYRTILKL